MARKRKKTTTAQRKEKKAEGLAKLAVNRAKAAEFAVTRNDCKGARAMGFGSARAYNSASKMSARAARKVKKVVGDKLNRVASACLI